MPVISIVNQKGGVGKTTLTVNLAASLVQKTGGSVLVVDIDPQANATDTLVETPVPSDQSILNIFDQPQSKHVVVHTCRLDQVYLIASHLSIAKREFDFHSIEDAQHRLARVLEPIRSSYTYVLVDCPPSLGLFTVNALLASDWVLIPVQMERYSILGLKDLLKTIRVLQEMNTKLSILGVLPNMVHRRYKIHMETLAYFRSTLKQTGIPFLEKELISTSAQLKQASAARRTIHEHDKKAPVYKQFNTLANWIREKVNSDEQ